MTRRKRGVHDPHALVGIPVNPKREAIMPPKNADHVTENLDTRGHMVALAKKPQTCSKWPNVVLSQARECQSTLCQSANRSEAQIVASRANASNSVKEAFRLSIRRSNCTTACSGSGVDSFLFLGMRDVRKEVIALLWRTSKHLTSTCFATQRKALMHVLLRDPAEGSS